MNAHIINIPDEEFFKNTCLQNGYLSTNIVINGLSPQALSSACRISYDMYADMKTIRINDVIFVHAGNNIYGLFQAKSEFKEDPTTHLDCLSLNVHYMENPNISGSGWKNKMTSYPANVNYRKISIAHYTDSYGNNLSFELPINSTEVFELKYKNKIFSIPERWRYADKKRTIRPLFDFEIEEFLHLIKIKNINNRTRLTINPATLSNYIDINFILDNRIIENEKIIEGWICDQIGRNQNIDNILGKIDCFGNNIPIGYLKFVDILGYQVIAKTIKFFKVIEIKRLECCFPNDIMQLVNYMDLIVNRLTDNNYGLVEGFLIAKHFSTECIEFTKKFNLLNRKINLIKIDYQPPSYNSLLLTRIV